MASFAFVDPTIWLAGYDLTGDLREVAVNVAVDELDATTFGNTYRVRKAGLKTVDFTAAGFWDSSPDSGIFTNLGTANRVVTVTADGGETNTAYLFRTGQFEYEQFGAVGEMTPFRVTSRGTDPQGVIRGRVAKEKANVSATGATGSVVNLGAVSSSQYLYCTFHVFSAGTTITVQLQSDDSSAMTTPTTQATIGPITTAGGTWVTRVAGPITDTHYRFNVSAITGTFSIAGAIGIGS